jgi:hypothetical protein
MPFTVTFNSNEDVICIKLHGEINLLSVIQIATEVAHTAKKHDSFRILNDAREASVKLSTLEIVQLPKVFSEILAEMGIQINKFRRAIIVSNYMDDFTFFETVSMNRGQNVMLFREMKEAREWLFKDMDV